MRHQAWEDEVPMELRTALGKAVDIARKAERQASCSHERTAQRYGNDHHGEVELTTCLDCGLMRISK